MRLTQCRACKGALATPFCDLGLQPLANSFRAAPVERDDEFKAPLRARVCASCRLVQLDHLVSAESIFTDYPYLSSVSSTWVAHAKEFCMSMLQVRRPRLVVELASNDGYLLQHFKAAGIQCLGVEPASNVAALAQARGIDTKVGFFGLKAAEEITESHGAADLIIANNVLAHVPDVNDFVAGIKRLLAPDGQVSIECPHLVRLVEHVQFDTIYHEHYAYWSLLSLERLLESHGLAAQDAIALPTHGGSLRILAGHAGRAAPQAEGLLRIREQERMLGLSGDAYYAGFEARISAVMEEFDQFLAGCAARGERVAAYGAAAKGNTFLNRLGPSARQILCVADANPLKQGHFLPGSHRPIVAPHELRACDPDHIIVLPWNIAREVEAVLANIGLAGRMMVTAIPRLNLRRIAG